MPEPRTIRVFLSAVSDEFRTYRDLLRSDLTRQNVEVKVQEDFKDLGDVTLEKLDAYIKLCDAVVHLVGDLTGAAACKLSTEAILSKYPGLPRKFPPLGKDLEKGEPISYTQWEAWLALYHSKVLLIAKADCDAPRGLAYAPTDCSRMAQEKHLARLREVERYPGNVFTSPDNLAKQIALTTILDLLAKAQSTSRQFSGSDVAKTIGLPVAAAFSVLAIWLAARPLARLVPEGPMLPLAIVIVGICVLAIPFVYVFYLGLLAQGANPEGSIERQDYDRLRASLAGGNLAARLYSKWLTKFLDWIERFFGDPGMEDRTLFPHAFGLRKPAPLWTAPAFDRCMFLALIYPISTIFLIWTISGHVGPAEAALGLKPNLLGWWRSLIATTAALEGFVTWTLFWGKGPKSITWSYAGFPKATGAADSADVVIALCAVAGAAALTIAFGSTGAGAVAFSVAVAASVASSGRAAGAVAVAVAVPVAFGLAFGLAGAPQSTVAWVVTVACACSVGLLLLCAIAIKRQALDVFLVLFIPAMIIACLAVVGLFAPLQTWRYTGPLLLFLGLLTLINAPFNWASLGLTRALLRRGLELGGWWPYLLALLDACLAGVIIALLAVTMVIDVQAFDELAVHGGGEKAAVLPLPALFEGIAKNPGAPEYWWAYALLLSTMIPSLINLAIGGMAFTRGIPGVGRLLLHWIPEGRDVPDYRRPLAAIGLTVQMFSGAVLGIAAQAFLAWGLLFHIMPAVGLDLLWLCQQLAELDLPGNFFHLTGIIR